MRKVGQLCLLARAGCLTAVIGSDEVHRQVCKGLFFGSIVGVGLRSELSLCADLCMVGNRVPTRCTTVDRTCLGQCPSPLLREGVEQCKQASKQEAQAILAQAQV